MWRTDGRGTGKTRERGRGWSSKDRLDNTGGGRGKAEKKFASVSKMCTVRSSRRWIGRGYVSLLGFACNWR